QEYLNDTRDWGLLSTPQWIPQLPVTIGLVLFSYAILRDVHALRPPRRPAAHWGGVLAVGAMATALWWLGADRVPVGVTRIDWGSVALAAGALAAAFAWSGPRTALWVAALAGGLALVFHL